MLPFLLLLAFLGLAFACPESYPEFNATLTGDTGFFGPWFGDNKDGIWPKRDSNSAKTVIPYCYANKAAMDALEDYVTKGAAVWNRGLGGEPGPGSGHSLDFSLHLVPSKDWYCYRDSGEWNDMFPEDTVVIKLGSPGSFSGTSTLGHSPNGGAGRHFMEINADTSVAPSGLLDWVVAHELGHIFGLMHEHQRPDRDNYVQFNCINVIGYGQAIQRASQDGFTRDQLCGNLNVANHYGFAASQYIKWTNENLRVSTGFDYNSIMNYPSWVASNPDLISLDPGNTDYYPMAKLINRQKHFFQLPAKDFTISELDAAAIKSMYPWTSGGGSAKNEAGKEDGNGAASTAESLSTYETQPPIASTKRSSEATTNETQESVVSTNPNLLQTDDTGSLWHPLKLWLRNKDSHTVIYYCYQDVISYNLLHEAVNNGWETWSRKLKEAGTESKHSLSFERYPRAADKLQWCRDPNGGKWNKDNPKETVMIFYNGSPEFGGRASMGYDASKPRKAGRHRMEIGESSYASKSFIVAHELAHIFAIDHEFQRPDRDYYFVYKCENVIGSEEAYKKAREHWFSKESLCTEPELMDDYGFPQGKNFPIETHEDLWKSHKFDVHSITNCPSLLSANLDIVNKDPKDPENYPLVFYNINDGSKSIIPTPPPYPQFSISDLDAENIRQLYPWDKADAKNIVGRSKLRPEDVKNITLIEEASTMVTVALP